MPAAVRERPPRKGPIILYFIPLNAFSSGLASSFSPFAAFGALVGFCIEGAFWAGCVGLAALDCRSGLVWATGVIRQKFASRQMRVTRAKGALGRTGSEPMIMCSPGKM